VHHFRAGLHLCAEAEDSGRNLPGRDRSHPSRPNALTHVQCLQTAACHRLLFDCLTVWTCPIMQARCVPRRAALGAHRLAGAGPAISARRETAQPVRHDAFRASILWHRTTDSLGPGALSTKPCDARYEGRQPARGRGDALPDYLWLRRLPEDRGGRFRSGSGQTGSSDSEDTVSCFSVGTAQDLWYDAVRCSPSG
jgi:hypothetical protein